MERIVQRVDAGVPQAPRLKNAAAYVRVSDGKDAMLHSLAAQVSYYSELIQRRPDWWFAGVYADEAITGTKDSRAEFQRLLADCRAGKIDLVLTKSISRFARNTVTLLETAREFKEMGVDIFFEKENIHSMSGDGELMLTILASYAQEESRSVSENCKWRIRKDFQVGKPISVSMYGLKIDHGLITVVPEEAEVVRMIFRDYADGMGRNAILRKLDELGIPAKDGELWHDSVISAMLENEKYTGDLLIQKYYCPDHLSKETKRNRGELRQYYIKDNHEAIVDRELFVRVQEMIGRTRESHGTRGPRSTYPFLERIICGGYGRHYVRKTTNGKISWQCGTYLQRGKSHCAAKQVPEDILIRETCAMLGLASFDETVFASAVRQIRIPQPNHLLYILADETEVERVWKDRSRAESWNMVVLPCPEGPMNALTFA